MSSFGITKCDVPNCGDSYTIEFNKSVPPNHYSEKWLTVGGWNICPTHNNPFRLILIDLGLKPHGR